MKQYQLTDYIRYLEDGEKSQSTIQSYQHEASEFLNFIADRELSKEEAIRYKETLYTAGYKPSTINAKISALNGYFTFLGRPDLKVGLEKIQRKPFVPKNMELSKDEYMKMIHTAEKKHDWRMTLLLQTLGSTGIRVSELESITREAVEKGEVVIRLKGKTRYVLLMDNLAESLLKYCDTFNIQSGPVFITSSGTPLNRSNIWRMLKHLAADAGVEKDKVYPHNLRHLFARSFYEVDKDIAKLADIMGHSNINTTRIYVATTSDQYGTILERMGLLEDE